MKVRKKHIGIILIIMIIGSTVLIGKTISTTWDSLVGYAKNFMNQKTNDLQKLTGTGSLVNSKDNLKDSKITGEDYVNDNRYYPYYTIIGKKEKKIYQQIYQNIISYQTTFIPVTTIDKNQLETAITAVYNDHPEIFWTDLNYSYKYLKNGEIVQIILTFNHTIETIESSKTSFENAANKIINEANQLSTNYEKEKYVHDVIIKRTVYDKDADLNQSAYSALVYNSSVCAGYSKAFQYIMIKLGIPTYYVSGSAGEDHAWNIIQLADGYYNVDVTWDDSKGISYYYFNIPDSEFSQTHTRTELSRYLPLCTASQYKGIKSEPKKTIVTERKPKEPEEKKIIIEPTPSVEEPPEEIDNKKSEEEIIEKEESETDIEIEEPIEKETKEEKSSES